MSIFEITAEDEGTRARTGILLTRHARVETPVFMPVATRANVKLMPTWDLMDAGIKAIICNSFLLHLRPGEGLINSMGGIHTFMNWNGAVFTDSGGFQAIRRGFLQGIEEEGIRFRSPYDGRSVLLTPEDSARIQVELGTNVAMALDFCPKAGSDRATVKRAVELTNAWAKRFLMEFKSDGGEIAFGITQGGTYPDLRLASTTALASMDFDGFAIGGLSIGESEDEMYDMLALSSRILPEEKPRYFMGLGGMEQVLKAVEMGVDIFDSVYPTRNGRHGTALVRGGRINVANRKYANDSGPIDEDCRCKVCRSYSLSYLHHLVREKEMLGMYLLTYHNIHFMAEFMKDVRAGIREGDIPRVREKYINVHQKYNI